MFQQMKYKVTQKELVRSWVKLRGSTNSKFSRFKKKKKEKNNLHETLRFQQKSLVGNYSLSPVVALRLKFETSSCLRKACHDMSTAKEILGSGEKQLLVQARLRYKTGFD